MIIWSGWGILVALSLFAGGFAGMAFAELLENLFGAATGKLDDALIFFGAAICNWGLGRFLYRESACDVTPSHTLFFIPFRVYTFLFLGMAVFFIFHSTMQPPIPAYTDENKARYEQILKRYSNKTGVCGGNTQGAIRAAKRFQEEAISTEARKFDSREIKTTYGKNNFATYCFESGEAVLFITDVQDVRIYRESDAKQALRLICRRIAEEAAAQIRIGRGLPLHVLIRDGNSTHASLVEEPDGGWRIDSDSGSSKRLIHLFDEETEPVEEVADEEESEPENPDTPPAARATEMPAEDPSTEEEKPESPAPEPFSPSIPPPSFGSRSVDALHSLRRPDPEQFQPFLQHLPELSSQPRT